MSTPIQQPRTPTRAKRAAGDRQTKPKPPVAENFAPRRRLFTVREYYAMLAAGVLHEDDRVELIAGEIIEMSPIGILHASCVKRLTHLFMAKVAGRAIVSVQNPIHIDGKTEPQPDITLLKYRDDFYSHAHPTPKDVLLVIEVADSTLDYDRSVKMPLYAQANIAQAMVIDLQSEIIEVYSKPAKGIYSRQQMRKRGDRVSLQKLRGVSLAVDEILG